MVLELTRSYYPKGTNGILKCEDRLICNTIELPWKENKKMVSCIPEGTYRLKKRYSQKFKWHIALENVTNRSLILFHPANNALEELNGCIAPVVSVCGPGLGLQSKKALEALKLIVYGTFDIKEPVVLIIKSELK